MTIGPPPLDRLVSLTRDLISIQSTRHLPHEIARGFSFLRNHLEAVEGLSLREVESGGVGSLVAMPQHIDVPDVLMLGHLDVIDHPNADVYQSVVRDGRIYGPGAGDMKGQVAIILELMCDLQRRFPGLSVGLAITSDEERGGEHGARFLFNDLRLRCGLALVPDGGSLGDVTVSEKGILHVRLSATGKESHAARPWLVPNALVRLSRALVAVHDHFDAMTKPEGASPDHWYPTCSPTIGRTANDTINCIPAEAHAYLDVRFPPPHTVADMLETVRSIAGPDVDVDIVMSAEPTHLAPDSEYLRITEQVTGTPARLVRASGGSDARFIAQHGIPVILSRPRVGNLHGTDEWIDIDSMGVFYRICAQFILQRTTTRSG